MQLKNLIAVFVIVLLIMVALDPRFTVQPVLSGPATIIVPDDYPTIQEAINNAPDGSTIFVRAGTYPEHLTINKPLSLIGEDRNRTIIDAEGIIGLIVSVTSDNTHIEGFTFQGAGGTYYGYHGVLNFSSSNNIITDNIIANNELYGITLDSSHNNSIVNNIITGNLNGILLRNSTDNTISGNMITGESQMGIWLYGSSNNMIVGNNVSYVDSGIKLQDYQWYDWYSSASNNSLINNYLAGNFWGIEIYASPKNTMKNNTILNNHCALQVSWYNYAYNSVSYFMQDIDESNTIDDRPIVYAVNHQDERVSLDASYVALVNCTNMTVENLHLNSGGGIVLAGTTNSTLGNLDVIGAMHCGIHLFRSNNNLIHGCEVHQNNLGIGLESSWSNIIEYSDVVKNVGGVALSGYEGGANQNRIVSNNLSNNRQYGLLISLASDNYVACNTVKDNYAGIALSGNDVNQMDNLVCYNEIVNNTCGVQLFSSLCGRIYGNSFLNNGQQAYISQSYADAWDDGYVCGGNYWSDYNGTDSFGGPYQNETGSDGIGDTFYVLDGTNTDHYPLMNPSMHSLGDVQPPLGKIDMRDIGYMARRFMCVPGDPLWDSDADINGDRKINMVDIGTAASHYGERYQ